jgi:hypothetical protein
LIVIFVKDPKRVNMRISLSRRILLLVLKREAGIDTGASSMLVTPPFASSWDLDYAREISSIASTKPSVASSIIGASLAQKGNTNTRCMQCTGLVLKLQCLKFHKLCFLNTWKKQTEKVR